MSNHRSERSESLGINLYHLPSPRIPGSLQFGASPSSRQGDPDVGYNSVANLDGPHAGQPLPSVSQLLIDTSHMLPRYLPAVGTPFYRRTLERQPQLFHNDHSIAQSAVYERYLPYPEDLSAGLYTARSSERQVSSRSAAGAYPALPGTLSTVNSGGKPLFESSSGTRARPPPVRPHVVDERYIDGEGLCYIYADGSYCPKDIDGVPVNANWGVTKAGKPRKRLAQACLTCREKKIKCHPNLPKCDQCHKSGRECRFENSPRSNRGALKPSAISRYENDNFTSGRRSSGPFSSPNSVQAPESSVSFQGTSQSPISEISMRTPSAGDSVQEMVDSERPYRPGISSLDITTVGAEDTLPCIPNTLPHLVPKYVEILADTKETRLVDSLASIWSTDPYSLDPNGTMHNIEGYFININDSLYHMFPRRRFLLWLPSLQKSLDDMMLLYAMLAMGSIFSDRQDKLSTMKRYARVARYAVKCRKHNPSLQLAQSQVILSLWYYAIGALAKSWSSTVDAARTVCELRYNIESGGIIVGQNQACEYGLHPQALMECRRRTFWVTYIMDHVSSFYSRAPVFISSQAAFLRLPCQEDLFEAQQYATVPYFESPSGNVARLEEDFSAASPMAFWIEIVSLWGQVVHHVFSLPHVPAEAYNTLFNDFYANTVRRLVEWARKLPNDLTLTAGNLERVVRTGNVNLFVSIHLLYHGTLMKLNRHARYQNFPVATVSQYVDRARHHAVEILRISAALTHHISERGPLRRITEPVTLNPYLGYTVLSAIDALSAIGLVADMHECVNFVKSGLHTVRRLSQFWDSSLLLVSLIETRLDNMVKSLHDREVVEGKVVFTVQSPSLDSQISSSMLLGERPLDTLEEDLLYGGLLRERLFNVLGLDEPSLSEEHVLRIRLSN